MSNQNTQFCFNAEEKSSVSLTYQDDRFPFFLKTIFICVLCFSIGSWFLSSVFNKETQSHRTIQSTRDPSALPQNTIALNPFVIRLKTKQGFQLTKMEVALQVNDSQVLAEVQNSINQVKDHLVFILSNQNISIFTDLKQRQVLEQEIITQLNLFLVQGEIKKIQLTDTVLP